MSGHGECALQGTSFEKDTAPHPLSAFMGPDSVMVNHHQQGQHVGTRVVCTLLVRQQVLKRASPFVLSMGTCLASVRTKEAMGLLHGFRKPVAFPAAPCSLALTTLAFLKCGLGAPESPLRPFQEIHEVKTMFMIILGFYLPVFGFFNSSPMNSVWWGLPKATQHAMTSTTLAVSGMCLLVL